MFFPTVKPKPGLQRGEKVLQPPHGFRIAEHEQPVVAQTVVKHWQKPALQHRVKVDQQVAAGNQIKSGEGRIQNDIMLGEQYAVTQALTDPVMVAVSGKEAGQALLRDIVFDGERVLPLPGHCDRLQVQVGGKDLEADIALRSMMLQRLGEQYRQGVGFLAGRAAHNPGPQIVPGGSVFDQFRECFLRQVGPGLRVTEERCDTNQHFPEQQLDFLAVLLQVVRIDGQVRNAMDGHAPFNATTECTGLVQGEIMPRVLLQDPYNGGDRPHREDFRCIWAARLLQACDASQDALGKFMYRRNDVHTARGNGAARHGIKLSGLGGLRHGQAAGCVDGLKAQGPV